MLYYATLFTIFLLLFGSVYYLFFRKMTSFIYNRILLLSLPILAILFSFVRLPYKQMDQIIYYGNFERNTPILPIILEQKIAPEDPSTIRPGTKSPFENLLINTSKILKIIYAFGVIFMFLYLFGSLLVYIKTTSLQSKNPCIIN